jgi:hypothetical protein
MDSATMLTAATYLLAIAAIGGILMALMRFGGIPRPPLWLAMIHGLVAVAGVTLVVWVVLNGEASQQVRIAALLFAGAALGGASLQVLYHAKGLALPIPLILGHAITAVLALGLLWLGAGRPLPF